MTIRVRCSELHHLMGEPRSKSEKLTQTAKTFVDELYIRYKYHRYKDITSRYIAKGLAVEEDSITLYSRFSKRFFVKNEDNLFNDFITGTPDLFVKEGDKVAEVIDIKSSWDIWTFFKSKRELNDAYYWQMQGYLWLTDCDRGTVVHCLVDTPDEIINDERRKLSWKMGSISGDSPEYVSAETELVKNMTYSDIPINERVVEWSVSRDEEAIKKIIEKVELVRETLKGL